MRTLAFDCHAAAREASHPAATAVARACGQAAVVAYMAGHSRNIVCYMSKSLNARARKKNLIGSDIRYPCGFVATCMGEFSGMYE